MPADTQSDESLEPILRMVLAANDDAHTLWPEEQARSAQASLLESQGYVPTLEDVAASLGKERAVSIFGSIVEKRRFNNKCLGINANCHFCGLSSDDISRYNFAMMRVDGTARRWGESVAGLALGAALLPLTGGLVFRLPGKSLSGPAIHMRLVICSKCITNNKGIFGTFTLTTRHASKHPLWSQITEAGFTKFLVRDTLPTAFRHGGHPAL